MKKSVMKKWVKALRSGKYQQTIGSLKNVDGYCCLGVLCDISKLSKFNNDARYFDEEGLLPIEVIEFARITNSAGQFFSNIKTRKVYKRLKCLSEYNDRGKSFKQIADIIEKHWEKL